MHLTLLDQTLWAAGLLCDAALLFVLIYRRRWYELPVFSAFIGYDLIRSLAFVFLFNIGSEHSHFVEYWCAALVDNALQIGFVTELARKLVPDHSGSNSRARRNFVVLASVSALIAVTLGLLVPARGLTQFDLIDMRFGIITMLLSCEVFVTMRFTANRWGFLWTNHLMGLAGGWTMYQVVATAADFSHLLRGWDWEEKTTDRLKAIVSLTACCIWIMSMWVPKRELGHLSPEIDQQLKHGAPLG